MIIWIKIDSLKKDLRKDFKKTSSKLNSSSMKAISSVLGFWTYWLVEKEEGEGSVEIVIGLDWIWIGILLEVDLEAWMKLFEDWRGGKSGLSMKLWFSWMMKEVEA